MIGYLLRTRICEGLCFGTLPMRSSGVGLSKGSNFFDESFGGPSFLGFLASAGQNLNWN